MKYRQLTAAGDYQFGAGSVFLSNTPGAVAQAISTRLRLLIGEWFLDNRIGLDETLIFGYNTQNTRDQEIKSLILNTTGVLGLANYQSRVDVRNFYVTAIVDTIYGRATINEIL